MSDDDDPIPYSASIAALCITLALFLILGAILFGAVDP